MAEVALTFLLQTLKDVLIDYKNLKRGAKNEFQQLSDGLCKLQAFLEDAAKKPEKSALFRQNEKQIRELVYEVEDTIDICVAQAKTKGFFSKALSMFSSNMEQKLRFLREERLAPTLGMIYFGGSSGTVEQPPREIKEDQSTGKQSYAKGGQSKIKQNKVAYFEDQATVITQLMKPGSKLDVISITGMAGLGKTTLAKNIFQDPNVIRKFRRRIWIGVSQPFSKRDMLLEILKTFTKNDTSGQTDDELSRTVCGRLEDEEFLLVVDDVQEVETWKVIREVLPKTNSEGKVLVTSRETVDVAASSDATVNMISHHLSPLGEDASWELLKFYVFDDHDENCPPELESIGRAIATNCGGLPMLIVMIGGMLKDHVSLHQKDWLEFSTKVIKLIKPDKGKSISNDSDQNTISGVVELAYNNLPDDLRLCFLYTGLFPQEHDIAASTLTQLWIAERFIRPSPERSYEETARKYLNDLINLKLLEAGKRRLGQVKTCRVVDKIHRFCKEKAMEESLFTVYENPYFYEVQNFYRVCFHSDPSDFLSGEPKPPRVRSFLCMLEETVLLEKDISTIPNAFKPLRVLNCKSTKFEKFPNVTKLILLKHMTLSIDNLKFLPQKISLLVNLQTLVVETTNTSSIRVKANIWKMMSLKHLKTKVAFILDNEKGEGTAENLQTISRLSPKSCSAALSHKAPNLKTLGIRGEITFEHLKTLSLENFRHLEKLKLENDVVHGAASKNSLVSLPDRFPASLKKLTLSNTYLDWKSHMPYLLSINTLEVLKLKDNAFFGVSWVALQIDIFRSLELLHIENLNLVTWEASTANFPQLSCLVVKKCLKLNVPESLRGKLDK